MAWSKTSPSIDDKSVQLGNEVNVLEEELGQGEVDRFCDIEVVVEVN